MTKKRDGSYFIVFFGLSIFVAGLIDLRLYTTAFVFSFISGFAFGWTRFTLVAAAGMIFVAIYQQPHFVGLICIYWVLAGAVVKTAARNLFPEYRDEWFLKNK